MVTLKLFLIVLALVLFALAALGAVEPVAGGLLAWCASTVV